MVDELELGKRLRLAREASGLTQDIVAAKLNLNRSAVSQIESGARAVTSLELDRLAFLYGRDIREFLRGEFQEKESLVALFRANPDVAESEEVMDSLRHCVALAREQSNLEKLLDIRRNGRAIATYPVITPTRKWDAIEQGEIVANEERQRLGLGFAPIEDIAQLLESEGIRTAPIALSNDVSGFTLNAPDVGPLIVVNRKHPAVRRRYSYAHEYAHVLFDRAKSGVVSRESERDSMLEVRANAFAAAFLMPENGIKYHLASLGKDKASRMQAQLFDESGTATVEMRGAAGARELKIYDIVQIAHVFGVSRTAVLYRLRNLRLINDAEHELLLHDDSASGRTLASLLGLTEPDEPGHRHFLHRFLGLALEALRRDEITTAKFFELARDAGMTDRVQAKQLITDAGIEAD